MNKGLGPEPGILTYMVHPGPRILTYMGPPPPGPGILTYMGPPNPSPSLGPAYPYSGIFGILGFGFFWNFGFTKNPQKIQKSGTQEDLVPRGDPSK